VNFLRQGIYRVKHKCRSYNYKDYTKRCDRVTRVKFHFIQLIDIGLHTILYVRSWLFSLTVPVWRW